MRRATVLVLVAATLAAAPAARAAGTAMYRGDAAHTGISAARGVAELHGVRWRFRTGGKVYSSPTIDGDSVYVGSADQRLYALELGSGRERWHYATGGRVSSSPAVAAGLVLFGSYDGWFYALAADTGRLVWRFATGGERRYAALHLHGAQPATERMPDPFDVFLSAPVVADGRVVFGSGDGHVYALELATGRLLWSAPTGDVVHAAPAYAHDTVYVGSWDSWFYALDAATGRVRWRFKTGEDPAIGNQVGIQGGAVVVGDTVYFGCRDSTLYALDAHSGTERWHYDNHGSWVIAAPLVADGRVYFLTSDSGLLHALALADRAEAYTLRLRWVSFSSPVLAAGRLYFGTHAGKLYSVDAASGRIAWEFATDGARAHAAELTAADGGPDYAAAFHGDFYDDIVAGADRMLATGAVLSSPAVADGLVVFGSSDGLVYALE